MTLFTFKRDKRDPIVADNQLTKSLNLQRAASGGFMGPAVQADALHREPVEQLFDQGLQNSRKAPGK